MRNILLFGLGRNFKVIVNEIFKSTIYRIIGFVDENINDDFIIIKQKKIFNRNKDLKKIIKLNKAKGLATIGDNYIRKKIYIRLVRLIKNLNGKN